MDLSIFMTLVTDGISGSAVYLMLGLGLVLIFSVTRVIFVPLGSIAVFAALSLSGMESGKLPVAVNLDVLLVVVAVLMEMYRLWRAGTLAKLPMAVLLWGVIPLIPSAFAFWVVGRDSEALRIVAAVLLVVPIGPLIDRVALRPVAHASVLRLLIVALVVDLIVSGFGLLWFGPAGIRTHASLQGVAQLNSTWFVGYQTLLIIGVAVLMSVFFYLALQRTRTGKVLHATASNQRGARLVGIRPRFTATVAQGISSLLAGIVGVMISSTMTIYFDSGLILALKAFVAAIVAGLASYPLTAVGALVVGIPESFAGFWFSGLGEVIVFGLLIPILIIRSAMAVQHHDDSEEADT